MFGQESSQIIMKELLSLVSKCGAILEALFFALCFMQFCMTGLTVCLVERGMQLQTTSSS